MTVSWPTRPIPGYSSQRSGRLTSWRRWALLAACLCLLLAGCQPSGARAGKAQPSGEQVSVTIDSVNYMEDRAAIYTLLDLSVNPPRAIGGASVHMLGTGGEKGCCVSLPKIWRPGMKLRLNWDEEDWNQRFPEKYSRELEIPRYNTPADLYVVFYADHKVELVVSEAEPGHPDWRGSIKQTPWEYCLAQHERKVCKAALPKQFDTASSLGTCAYMQREKVKDSDLLCMTAMHECMQDYEDETFCKGILWGERKK